MGISTLRPVIEAYEEIIPIAQLAKDHYRKTGWPLRIAVDEADWRFHNLTKQQVAVIKQTTRNPIEKAFFHRICKLLTLNIRLILVFDGPDAPAKYGRTGKRKVDRKKRELLINILDGLGIAHIEAPGEAEAECCRLQALDLVDAVWSQDSDCLMFGCSLWIRDFRTQKDGKSGNHIANTEKDEKMVRVVRTEDLKTKERLDREGCVLFAMLAGGDYNTQGLPGCGAQNAPKAARAGLGKNLCRRENQQGCREWRDKVLVPFLKRKSMHIAVPAHFPGFKTLQDYNRPKVHSDEHLRSVANMDKLINESQLFSVVCPRINIFWIPYLDKVGPVLLARFLADREESLAKEVMFDIKLVKTRARKTGEESPGPVLERKLSFLHMNVTNLQEREFRNWVSDRPGRPYPPFDSMHRATCEVPVFLLERLLPEEVLNPAPKAKPGPESTKRKSQTEPGSDTDSVPSVKKTKTKGNTDTTPSAKIVNTPKTSAKGTSSKTTASPCTIPVTNTYTPLSHRNVNTPTKRPIQTSPTRNIDNVIMIDDSDDDELRLPTPRARK